MFAVFNFCNFAASVSESAVNVSDGGFPHLCCGRYVDVIVMLASWYLAFGF